MNDGISRKRSTWLVAGLAAFLLLSVLAAATLGLRWFRERQAAHFQAALIQAIQKQVREKHRSKSADQMAASCKRPGCECVLSTARGGLDAELPVLDLLQAAAEPCKADPAFPGIRAEALVRAGKPEGLTEARDVLAKNPKDPYAHYAVALDAFMRNDPSRVVMESQDAAAAGRGAAARMLMGLTAYRLGRPDFAVGEFDAAVKLDPENLQALYDLALMNQLLNRYSEAREGYFKILGIDPKNQDARYNLAVLTHSVGADAEAKNNLERFAALNPPPEALAKLKAILAAPAISAAPEGPSGGPPASASAVPGPSVVLPGGGGRAPSAP